MHRLDRLWDEMKSAGKLHEFPDEYTLLKCVKCKIEFNSHNSEDYPGLYGCGEFSDDDFGDLVEKMRGKK